MTASTKTKKTAKKSASNAGSKATKQASEPKAQENAPLSPEKQELVTFVANNILNSVTLNQTVTILQQVALRDATSIVTQADDKKLQEIKTALEASKNPPKQDSQEPAAE